MMGSAIREGDIVHCLAWANAKGDRVGFEARILNLTGDRARVKILEMVPKSGLFRQNGLIGQDFNDYRDITPSDIGSTMWINTYVLEKPKSSGGGGWIWVIFIVLALYILGS